MQRTELVQQSKVDEIINLAFQLGEVQIFESFSEMDEEIIEIFDYQDYLNYFEKAINKKEKHIAFGLYYKEAQGFLRIKKIKLNQEKCNEKSFRYSIEGWGMIYIQLTLEKDKVECRIAVNTEKRAQNWEATNPELKSPNLWNWKVVDSNARKLIRVLKKK